MKRKLFYLFLLLSGIMQAQNVNLPDANFKQALLQNSTSIIMAAYSSSNTIITVDANNDGEIQVAEAANVFKMTFFRIPFSSENISSLEGIASFTNLKHLDCNNLALTNLTLAALTNLEVLVCNNNLLTALILPNTTALKQIDCSFNSLTALNIPPLAASSITNLNCSKNQLVSILVGGLINLKVFNCFDNNISGILDFSLCGLIESINCDHNTISGLIIGDKSHLSFLSCAINSIEELSIGYAPSLVVAQCIGNDMVSLDFSGCPIIETITAGSYNLRYLNIKNGSVIPPDGFLMVTASDQNSFLYVCIDEGEEAGLGDIYLYNSSVVANTYCSFFPGGDFNTIKGRLAFDVENNGCDNDDIYASYLRINMTNGIETIVSFVNEERTYEFYTQAGFYTLTPELENIEWYTITPPTATINFTDNNNNNVTQNFCITPNGVHPDIEVISMPIQSAVPGFDAPYQMLLKNKGNQLLSGNVTFNYDDSVLDFVSATQTFSSSGTGFLTWDYSNLMPFETRTFNVILNLNGPMDTPAVNIGNVLNFTASVTPTTGDETPVDNSFSLNQIVVGSFDPNDITCLEGDTVHPNKIGGYLHYNINFENTGTAPATFIVVKDIINTQQFDVNSLQLIDASHNVETRLTGNKLEFIFDDINLAAAGKGNVVFKIKTLPTLAVNSTVKQKADIFFDYNWPIATNDANTTFAVLSQGDFAKDSSVRLYPNPTKDNLTITTDSTIQSIQLYDVQGRLLQAQRFDAADAVVDISQRQAGIYFIKVLTDKGSKVEKVVKE